MSEINSEEKKGELAGKRKNSFFSFLILKKIHIFKK